MELKVLREWKPKCKLLFKAELDNAHKLLKAERKELKKMNILASEATLIKKGFRGDAMVDAHQPVVDEESGLV